jgi:hypothetical protein
MVGTVVAAYLFGLLFDPDDGGSMLLKKSVKIRDFIASQCQPTRGSIM